ncbi:amidase [Thermodesulfobacteriota bacterium]
MDPLFLHSGTRLAEMIRSGEITSREVVEAHIGRIEKVNPAINAVVATRFEEARSEADVADRLVLSTPPEELPPFHGVPCTIKECFALGGMPNTSGLVARKGIVVERDATTVSRFREAGAIPLGVTNVSELCMWMESNNRVYGRTCNPYNPGHIVGGSSGGEGAIVGAGASPFGLGSDIGGSIRMPAFFNGVFGHKPTGRMVPGTGQYPVAENRALRYLTTGPITKRAEDLMPLLRIFAGPDGVDDQCLPFELGEVSDVNIAELTVLDIRGNGAVKVSEDLRSAQSKCVDALSKRGARVKTVRVDGLERSLEIWSAMLSNAGGKTFSELLGNGKPIRALPEILRLSAGRSPHTIPAVFLALFEKAPKFFPSRTGKAVEAGRALRDALVELIGPDGVMLYPSYSRVAPAHNSPLFRPFDWIYTAIINVMELPSTQVPLGLNDDGLPLGVQVIGIHGNDHKTIAVAMELEKAFGGWVPPEQWS